LGCGEHLRRGELDERDDRIVVALEIGEHPELDVVELGRLRVEAVARSPFASRRSWTLYVVMMPLNSSFFAARTSGAPAPTFSVRRWARPTSLVRFRCIDART